MTRQSSEKRLYAGDQLKIGSAALAFISDRPEDAKRLDTKMINQKKQWGLGFWLLAALLLISVGYYGYFQAYTPIKIKWALKSVAKQIQAEKYVLAQNTLKHLLDLDLPLEQTPSGNGAAFPNGPWDHGGKIPPWGSGIRNGILKIVSGRIWRRQAG